MPLNKIIENMIDPNFVQKISGFYNVKQFKCDDGQYVKGDGKHDDTTGVQRALDTATGALFFPEGIYKVTSGLFLTRNIDLIGFSKRDSVIRGDGLSTTTDLLTIAITENWGMGDVRNWRIMNISLFPNASGRHGLAITDSGLPILGATISNCDCEAITTNGGYGLYIKDNFSHGRITQNGLGSIYLACYDANLIDKNLFSGEKIAITFDIIDGVRNNTVRDNTIVNRDGMVHVINGSNIRIQNNQFEHMQGQGINLSPHSAMVWLEGKDRISDNIVISENNFGGGTNLDRSIYVDNANKAIIEKNYLIAVNVADIELTSKAKNCIIKSDNKALTQDSNPRSDELFNAVVVDNGVGTIGVIKSPVTQNSWEGGKFCKDESGVVHFYSSLSKGLINVGDTVLTLPKLFRPKMGSSLLAFTPNGTGLLKQGLNGKVVVASLDSNVDVKIVSFVADEENNGDYIVYDDFDRADSLTLGTTETGQTWEVVNNNMRILNNKVTLISDTTPSSDFALINTGSPNGKVQCVFDFVPVTYTKICRLVFRYVDANNYLYLTAFDISGYEYSVYEVVNGVETRLFGTNTLVYTSGDKVEIVMDNNNITFMLNGVVGMSTEVVTRFNTATKHGFGLFDDMSGAIDKFRVES